MDHDEDNENDNDKEDNMDSNNDIQVIRAELKKLSRMTEENHAMIRVIYRQARLSILFSILKWIIIIGLAIGSFYYIQPFLQQIGAIYQSITGNKVDFMSLFNKFK